MSRQECELFSILPEDLSGSMANLVGRKGVLVLLHSSQPPLIPLLSYLVKIAHSQIRRSSHELSGHFLVTYTTSTVQILGVSMFSLLKFERTSLAVGAAR